MSKKKVKVKTKAEDIGDLSVAAQQHQRFIDQSVRDDDVPDVRRGRRRVVAESKEHGTWWDPIEVQIRDIPLMPEYKVWHDEAGARQSTVTRPRETPAEAIRRRRF